MAWHRQYRPQRVADLHITSVREQLLAVLNSGQFSQAYLFAGPKGTGKTSTARILARVLNEPKNEEALLSGKGKLEEPSSETSLQRQIAAGQSIVVIEQDAASHRGIDDVRQLQEQISVIPSEGYIRVVILDEVHMLTTEAFNALLKMLEEPPSRVVFILATTELHKVPATVQSRCQLIQFRQATLEEIAAALQNIAKQEEFELSEKIAQRVATAAKGSFRDAVKLLEQVVHDKAVDERLLDLAAGADLGAEVLLRSLAQKKLPEVSAYFQEARQRGQSLKALEGALIAALQQRLHRAIAREEGQSTIRTILALLEHLSRRLEGSEPLEGLKLELACLSWCLEDSAAPSPEKPASKPPAAACEIEEPTYAVTSTVTAVKNAPAVEKTSSPAQKLDAPTLTSPLSSERAAKEWGSFLLALRLHSQALEAIVRNCVFLGMENGKVKLQLGLPFHKEQLESPKYVGPLRQALEQIFGKGVGIEYVIELSPDLKGIEAQDQDTGDEQLLKAVEEAVLSLG